jgi:hypothetical protein
MLLKMAPGLKRIDFGAGLVGLADTRSGASGVAEVVVLLVDLAVAVDGQRSDSDSAFTTDTPTHAGRRKPCRSDRRTCRRRAARS